MLKQERESLITTNRKYINLLNFKVIWKFRKQSIFTLQVQIKGIVYWVPCRLMHSSSKCRFSKFSYVFTFSSCGFHCRVAFDVGILLQPPRSTNTIYTVFTTNLFCFSYTHYFCSDFHKRHTIKTLSYPVYNSTDFFILFTHTKPWLRFLLTQLRSRLFLPSSSLANLLTLFVVSLFFFSIFFFNYVETFPIYAWYKNLLVYHSVSRYFIIIISLPATHCCCSCWLEGGKQLIDDVYLAVCQSITSEKITTMHSRMCESTVFCFGNLIFRHSCLW